jgi:hypothetical protein
MEAQSCLLKRHRRTGLRRGVRAVADIVSASIGDAGRNVSFDLRMTFELLLTPWDLRGIKAARIADSGAPPVSLPALSLRRETA